MEALKKLDNVIGNLTGRAFFREPATDEAIAALEQEMGSELPEAYKTFLRAHDGGFICDEAIPKEEMAESLGDAAWNSDVLLGVAEIRERFVELRAVLTEAAEIFGEIDGVYIPLCHTHGQELLVFKGPFSSVADSEILDAFHEAPPNAWEPIYPSFVDLLEDYVRNEGRIETIA